MGSSFFTGVKEALPDPIFQLMTAFKEDPRVDKVNLGVGLYQDESLQTPILKSVKAAEKYLLAHETTKEYLPISGDPGYVEGIEKLLFGKKEKHVCGLQAPGGTGSLRIGAEFLHETVGKDVLVPDPTWPNHVAVFKQCGYQIHRYPYYKNHRLYMEGILDALRKAPKRSVVVLHACCHNPTGADPSDAQWKEIEKVLVEKELFPFFDFAYQGLGRGIEEDAAVIRSLASQSIEFMVACSQSKNFGLYSERVGALFVHTASGKVVLSHLKRLARASYSNPPRHGAAIAAQILANAELHTMWRREVDAMRSRIMGLRTALVTALQEKQKGHDFSFLLPRVGMFCFLGLKEAQVEKLRKDHGIYMAAEGRINLAGLTLQNVPKVATSICSVLREIS